MNTASKIKWYDALAVLVLFCLLFFQTLWHAVDKSPVFDEGIHILSGYSILHSQSGNSAVYDFQHPPLLHCLYGLPLLIWHVDPPKNAELFPSDAHAIEVSWSSMTPLAERLIYGSRVSPGNILLGERLVNIALLSCLAILILVWSSQMYGIRGGLLSLYFFVFCPNLIAHGSLATSDLGSAFTAILFLYVFTGFAKHGGWFRMLLSGIFLGIALLTKFSALFLVPLFAVWTFFFLKMEGRGFIKALRSVGVILFAAWLVFCVGYLFKDVFIFHVVSPEGWDYLKAGELFRKIYRILPFPDQALRGLLVHYWHNKVGLGGFLFGDISYNGWLIYFPVAFLLKTPSVTLAAFFLLLFLLIEPFRNCVRQKFQCLRSADDVPASGQHISADELIVLSAMVLYMFGAMTSRLNIGIRHILILYPLLYLLFGRLSLFFSSIVSRSMCWTFLLLFVLLPAEVFSVAPDYIAFFNRIVGGPEQGIRYLSDSNIDWGQDLKNLSTFMKKEGDPELFLSYFGSISPARYGLRYHCLRSPFPFCRFAEAEAEPGPAVPGKKCLLAVSVSNLQGTCFIREENNPFSWLNGRDPVAKIGYSIYVYDITSDAEARKKLLWMLEKNVDPPKP